MVIPLGNKVRTEVIDSVLGQLSDGIWGNSRGMEKYWKYARTNGTNIQVNTDYWGSGFSGKSEKDVCNWFANKAKQVVKIWAEDYGLGDVWDRNNTDVVDYMGGHEVPEITVADVYECYDFLKGRSGKKYGTAPVEEPVDDEPYEVLDDVVEPGVSGGMNPSQQDLEDFFTGASTKTSRKGYVKASDNCYNSCYIETETGEKWTLDELKDYWNKEKANDWVLSQFNSFEDWFNTSLDNFYFKPCYDDEVEACGYIGASEDIFAYGKCIGYGVDYRNMHTATHGILVFSDKDEAEYAHLDLMRAAAVDDNHKSNFVVEDVFNSAVEVLEDINYRNFTKIDGEKIYPYHDDEFIIIVNNVAVDLYL